eukprot:11136218-Alexandrium_andersonii.AAC.1
MFGDPLLGGCPDHVLQHRKLAPGRMLPRQGGGLHDQLEHAVQVGFGHRACVRKVALEWHWRPHRRVFA